jgi:hypothetical protein
MLHVGGRGQHVRHPPTTTHAMFRRPRVKPDADAPLPIERVLITPGRGSEPASTVTSQLRRRVPRLGCARRAQTSARKEREPRHRSPLV